MCVMGSGVVAVETSDRLESRRAPITAWLQVANIATLAVVSLILFKLYKAVLRFYQWATGLPQSYDDIRTVLFLGPKNELNQYLLQELSVKLSIPVSYIREDSNISAGESERRNLLYGGDWGNHSRDEVLQLCQKIAANYGSVDLLVVSEQQEQTSNTPIDFLAQVNQQLLTQFWIVMAFLPGMLERNRGYILSIALDKRSSLANAGVMRTMYEDVVQRKSDVVLTLVEHNSLLARFLPNLPTNVLAHLAVDALGRSEVVTLPSIYHYFLILPVLLGRMYLKPFLDFLWSPRTRSPRRTPR